MDIQKLLNAMSDASQRERSNYHTTFGELIDHLKSAESSLEITPKIVGISAYRGYYCDIALCTESIGVSAYKTPRDFEDESVKYDDWLKENFVTFELSKNPRELAVQLESLIGLYFDGYKGGYNQITRDKPLWIAEDYGDCSQIAVIEIQEDLKLITKIIY